MSTATSYEENDKASVLGKQVLAPREPGQITLRAYQEELLTYARDGLSVLIILPTGTGKTYIILKYVQVPCRKHSQTCFLCLYVCTCSQQTTNNVCYTCFSKQWHTINHQQSQRPDVEICFPLNKLSIIFL